MNRSHETQNSPYRTSAPPSSTPLHVRAAELIGIGIGQPEATKLLLDEGYDPDQVHAEVSDLVIAREHEKQRAAHRSLFYGGLWLLGGLAVTLGTFLSSGETGQFTVAYGAILYGGARVCHGILEA